MGSGIRAIPIPTHRDAGDKKLSGGACIKRYAGEGGRPGFFVSADSKRLTDGDSVSANFKGVRREWLWLVLEKAWGYTPGVFAKKSAKRWEERRCATLLQVKSVKQRTKSVVLEGFWRVGGEGHDAR